MSRRILIVEDEAPIREMLSFVMEQHGYQAVEANDFDAAVDKIAEPYPDMVLLDWMLPGGSGLQLAKKLKAMILPVIFLSSCSPQEAKKKIKLKAWKWVLMTILPNLFPQKSLWPACAPFSPRCANRARRTAGS